MRTIVLENGGYVYEEYKLFIQGIDPNYKLVSTETRDWMIKDDYGIAGLISQPSLENIIVSSTFEMKMPPRCSDKFSRDWEGYSQLEHYMGIIWAVVRLRGRLGIQKLTVHIDYRSCVDFLTDLKDDHWGEGFKTSFQTMIRQEDGDGLLVKIYNDFEFICDLNEENVY